VSKWLVVAFMCVMAACSSTQAFAQEEERVEYSWGTVKSISSDQIVVMEYDYDRDEDVESAYSINPNVEFRGVETLKDIAVGDDLDIEYVIQSGKKITKVIIAEKSAIKIYFPRCTIDNDQYLLPIPSHVLLYVPVHFFRYYSVCPGARMAPVCISRFIEIIQNISQEVNILVLSAR